MRIRFVLTGWINHLPYVTITVSECYSTEEIEYEKKVVEKMRAAEGTTAWNAEQFIKNHYSRAHITLEVAED